jgi:CheY-like chemotaxis protein
MNRNHEAGEIVRPATSYRRGEIIGSAAALGVAPPPAPPAQASRPPAPGPAPQPMPASATPAPASIPGVASPDAVPAAAARPRSDAADRRLAVPPQRSERPAPERGPATAQRRPPDGLALIELLTGLAEYHDPYFRGASSFTRHLAAAIAGRLGMGAGEIESLAYASLLRDTGRMAMNGTLIPATASVGSGDRNRIERHVGIGLDMLKSADLPPGAIEAIRHHHEQWDGSGYPDGLRGEEIPVLARILQVADSFAAMVSARPYRPPKRLDEATRELQESAGRLYDPAVVRALLGVIADHEFRTAGFALHDHILIVHADQSHGVTLAMELCARGFLAEVAPDLATARGRLPGIPVGAVLLAGVEPVGEAAAFVTHVRNIPRYREIPVIAFDLRTASARVAMISAGADACLAADFEPEELLGTLGAAIGRTRRVQELRAWDARETHHRNAGDGASGGPAEAGSTGLQGNLSEFPVTWLLQTLQYDGRGVVVTIQTAAGAGSVVLQSGVLVHAETEWSSGEAAFNDILDWTEGSFRVQPSTGVVRRTIERQMMHLILDHAARNDETHAPFGAIATD